MNKYIDFNRYLLLFSSSGILALAAVDSNMIYKGFWVFFGILHLGLFIKSEIHRGYDEEEGKG